MFNKIKGAFINAVTNLDGTLDGGEQYSNNPPRPGDLVVGRPIFTLPSNLKRSNRGPFLKYRYTRPAFLQLITDDEILGSADQVIRPIIVPRDISKLSWNSGYAETVNAGKSVRNEDQATIHKGLLRAVISKETIQSKIADMVSIRLRQPRVSHSRIVDGVEAKLSVPIAIKTGESSSTPLDSSHKIVTSSDVDQKTNSSDSVEVKKEPLPGKLNISGEVSSEKSCIESCDSKGEDQIPQSVENWTDAAADLISPTTPLPFPNELTSPTESITRVIASSDELGTQKKPQMVEESLPYVYFALFDGHAGSDVAVAASNRLHRILNEKLQSISDLLIAFGIEESPPWEESDPDSTSPREERGSIFVPKFSSDAMFSIHDPVKDKTITVDNLITGALEKAFWEMDQEIERDKIDYYMRGGCTALVALFILGKLYVSNAGDSRSIVYKDSNIVPMSFDFTPESERTRIKYLGLLRPEFLGNDFTHVEFIRRPNRKDLGKELLYRDAFMSGWAYKRVTPEDLKFPIVFGEGKRSRVAATIGVTRGFGDHELQAANSDVHLKPFLTCQPEVKILDLEHDDGLTDSDVLIMGTDGLWDVTTNDEAVEIVQKALDHFPVNDSQRFKYRYVSAAQDLVMHSRGKSKQNGTWITSDSKLATIDDISTFVIPLKPYQQEYIKWKEARRLVSQSTQPS